MQALLHMPKGLTRQGLKGKTICVSYFSPLQVEKVLVLPKSDAP
jgi:hypothetical protein